MSTVTVGLTGGMASGKSTVARWLADAGLTVVDADALVAELYQAGGEGAARVAELLGEGMLTPSGAVDHRRVAERVFADPEARRRLEATVHPLVRRRFAELATAAAGPAVLEATLLVEAGYAPDFDLVVSVEADPEARLERAVARGLGEPQARARLTAQGDGAARRAGAHRVLRNDGTLQDLRARTDELLAEIRRLESANARSAGAKIVPGSEDG